MTEKNEDKTKRIHSRERRENKRDTDTMSTFWFDGTNKTINMGDQTRSYDDTCAALRFFFFFALVNQPHKPGGRPVIGNSF